MIGEIRRVVLMDVEGVAEDRKPTGRAARRVARSPQASRWAVARSAIRAGARGSEAPPLTYSFVILVLLFGLLSSPAFADTLLLKSGERINGTITNQSRESVIIRRADGSTRTILKADIERTFFGDAEEQRYRKEQEAIRERQAAERRKREEAARRKREEDARRKREKAERRRALEEREEQLDRREADLKQRETRVTEREHRLEQEGDREPAGPAPDYTLRLRAGIAGGSFISDLEERLGQDLEYAALTFGGIGGATPWESDGYAGFPLAVGLDYESWSFDIAYERTEGEGVFQGLIYLPSIAFGGLSASASQLSLYTARLIRHRVDVQAAYRLYGGEQAGPKLHLTGGLRRQEGDGRLSTTSIVSIDISGVSFAQLSQSLRSDYVYEDTGPLFGLGFRYDFAGGWDVHTTLRIFRLRGGEQLSEFSVALNSDLSAETEAISETGDHLIRGYEWTLGFGYSIGRARLFFDFTGERSRVRDWNVQRFTASSSAFTQSGALAAYLLSRDGSEHADLRRGIHFGVEFSL